LAVGCEPTCIYELQVDEMVHLLGIAESQSEMRYM